ncbi:hypothetical protein LINPERHAP1_LOCUS19208 [Linum perenne]
MGHTISYCEQPGTSQEISGENKRRYESWMRVETARKTEGITTCWEGNGKQPIAGQRASLPIIPGLERSNDTRTPRQGFKSFGPTLTPGPNSPGAKHLYWSAEQREQIRRATPQIQNTKGQELLNLSPQVFHQPNNIQMIQSMAMFHTNLGQEKIITMPIAYLVQPLRNLKVDHISDTLDQIMGRLEVTRAFAPPEFEVPENQLLAYAPQLRIHRSQNPGQANVGKLWLLGIQYIGPKYTWCNIQEGNRKVMQRLDRALGNLGWLAIHPTCEIIHCTRTKSDQCPIYLKAEGGPTPTGSRRFYYEKGRREAEGNKECVEMNWSRGKSSNENLENLQKSLTRWKKATIRVNKDTIKRLMLELQCLEALPRDLIREALPARTA